MIGISYMLISILVGIRLMSCKTFTTPDGCPYPYDRGTYGFKYTKPRVCDTLLPDQLSSLPAQTKKSPFNLSMEAVENSDDDYYNVVVAGPSEEESDLTIAGAVIRVYKIKLNGKVGIPVGYFDTDPAAAAGWRTFCCGTSMFYNLVYIFITKETPTTIASVTPSLLSILWYPLNFKEGTVVFKASVFSDNKTYWKVKSPKYKIPYAYKEPETTSELSVAVA